MTASLLALSVSRTREGGVTVSLRYSYEGRPPSLKKRAGMAKALLSEALDRLETGKPVDLGFAEDAVRRVRTDTMEA
jgi:hypothetical protein